MSADRADISVFVILSHFLSLRVLEVLDDVITFYIHQSDFF